MPDPDPLYEPYADDYEIHAAESPYNAFYDRPAVLQALGDVQGQRVLDAGCGPGLYAEQLVERGAEVVGVDESPRMIELAQARLGDKAKFRVHDLQEPLHWLEDETFDAAICALVIHHLDTRVPALKEIYRVLVSGGRMVLSTHHPTDDWLRHGGNYFDQQLITETWSRGWEIRHWRMPLADVVTEFADAGFYIKTILEPRPTQEMRLVSSDDYQKLNRQPGFIIFDLAKMT